MTLEDTIRQMLLDIYCKEYIKNLKVVNLLDGDNIIGYCLILDLNNHEKPLILNKQGTEEEFLGFIKEELHYRQLQKTIYSTSYKVCNG